MIAILWKMFKLSEMLRMNGIRTAAIQCDSFLGDYRRRSFQCAKQLVRGEAAHADPESTVRSRREFYGLPGEFRDTDVMIDTGTIGSLRDRLETAIHERCA